MQYLLHTWVLQSETDSYRIKIYTLHRETERDRSILNFRTIPWTCQEGLAILRELEEKVNVSYSLPYVRLQLRDLIEKGLDLVVLLHQQRAWERLCASAYPPVSSGHRIWSYQFCQWTAQIRGFPFCIFMTSEKYSNFLKVIQSFGCIWYI